MDEAIIEKKGIEVQVGTVTEITTVIIQGKDLSEVEIQVEVGIEKDNHDHGLEQDQKVEEIVIDQEQSQDPDQLQGLVQKEIELGTESMITLQGNAPMPLQMKIQMA